MKRTLLLTLVVLCCASAAFAQGGDIIVLDDVDGTTCNLNDASKSVALCNYYVFHLFAAGVTGSQFMIQSGHMGIAFPDTPVFGVTIGTSAAGVSIGYGACLASPIHILTLSYYCQGITPPCATMVVVGHPTATPPGLLVVDCDDNLIPANGRTSYIDDDGSCPCSVVPTEETTWGQMKALYE